MWLYLLRGKDEAAEAIQRFQARVERETGRKLKTLRTDRGGEFNSIDFAGSAPASHRSKQNGVVERRNQTVVRTARCMLKAMGVPARFWSEAVTTAVSVLNRAYTKSVQGKTPFEAWSGRKPSVDFLRVFGCIAHVKDTRPHLSKLEDRSKSDTTCKHRISLSLTITENEHKLKHRERREWFFALRTTPIFSVLLFIQLQIKATNDQRKTCARSTMIASSHDRIVS
jgi:hypothetical protein